jgi:DNA polymerase I-like protein with 3'-5' exonuclease and polymerase domains
MNKIALIDKQPNNVNWTRYLKFEFDQYHMSSVPRTKLLKKDVDIEFDPDCYEFIVLVGSEAVKFFTGLGAIGEKAGHLINEKFIPLINPAMLAFKPEAKPAFEKALEKLHRNIEGDLVVKTHGDFRGIEDEVEAAAYLKEILNDSGTIVCVDTETSSLYPRQGHVLGISISNGVRKGAYISSDAISEEVHDLFQLIFEVKEKIVFHNAKFDIAMLRYHFNFDFDESKVEDTLLMHYMLDESIASHGLKDLTLKFLDYGDYDRALEQFKDDYIKINGIRKDEFNYSMIPFDIMYPYAATDTAATFELYALFAGILYKSKEILKAYKEIVMPACFLLIDMEDAGVPFSKERLTFAEKTVSKKLYDAKLALSMMPEVQDFEYSQQKDFNANSPTQLRKLLFDYLGLKSPGKLTDTGALSTDAEVLESLKGQHPVIENILTIRKLGKIYNTYIVNLLAALDKDGRVRTNFNQSSTTSGRLSSSGKFNAQQLPREEPAIKGSIVARPGYKIVSQDLATAEMYYAAVLSGDTNLQEVFKSGGDFHSSIAKKVFKLKCVVAEVKKLYPIERQAAKAVSFGILYGSGPKKVSETVTKSAGKNFSKDEAVEVIEDYFNTFPKLRKWLDNSKSFIEKNGYIYSAFGRKRRLKNVFSPDKGIASHEVRSGVNFLIQSVASDVNILAAVDARREIAKRKLDARIFMLVHDSIVAEVREDQVEEYCKMLREVTQRDRGIGIPGAPIGVDQEIGDDYSFGDFLGKYGEDFSKYQVSGVSDPKISRIDEAGDVADSEPDIYGEPVPY